MATCSAIVTGSIILILAITLLGIIVYLITRNASWIVSEIVIDEHSTHLAAARSLNRLCFSHQIRAALPKTQKRESWLTPLDKKSHISKSHFTSVLPGNVAVTPSTYYLESSHDLRRYLTRGDPVKIGPQLFIIDTETKRGDFKLGLSERHYKQAFTSNRVPLGKTADISGGLIGPLVQGVSLYTTEWVSDGRHTWTGPSGGAIGYWASNGEWVNGDCPAKFNHGYLPLWLGPKGKVVKELDINLLLGCDGNYCPTPTITLNENNIVDENENEQLQNDVLSNWVSKVSEPVLMNNRPLYTDTPLMIHQSVPMRAPVQMPDHHQPPDYHHHPVAMPVPPQTSSLLIPVDVVNTGFTTFENLNSVDDTYNNTLPLDLSLDKSPLSQSIHNTNKMADNTELSDAIWKRMNVIQ